MNWRKILKNKSKEEKINDWQMSMKKDEKVKFKNIIYKVKDVKKGKKEKKINSK